MAAKTGIEWTGSTWTPIRARNRATGKVGWHCTHATPGCEHCYAESLNLRLGTGLPFKPGHEKDIELLLDEKMLGQPRRWRKPRTIFVCSMTDLFADFVTDAWIDAVFAEMAAAPQHTFQILTKRAERMRSYITGFEARRSDWDCDSGLDWCAWPLPNVWLGVSAEDQRRADERIPHLLETPAAVRFVSTEPLLGPITYRWQRWNDLGWIIVGGESGPDARPCDVAWIRSIVEQCRTAGVPCFVKQLGARPMINGVPILGLRDRKGGDPAEWLLPLQVREMPSLATIEGLERAGR